jgi:hypothetical protein
VPAAGRVAAHGAAFQAKDASILGVSSIERIEKLALDESKWLFASMLLATLAVAALVGRRSWWAASAGRRVMWATGLFYGCVIGVMSSGHLLAVLIEAGRGTLQGSLWLLVLLGLALFVPAWRLALRAGRSTEEEGRWRSVSLDVWLAAALLAFGLHNLPLAVPAVLRIAYRFHSGRAVGWIIVAVMVAVNLALFVGAFVFLRSGQSFEQFEGM